MSLHPTSPVARLVPNDQFDGPIAFEMILLSCPVRVFDRNDFMATDDWLWVEAVAVDP